MPPIIEIKNLHKSYQIDTDKNIEILKGINLEINDNDFCIIYGASGSGKSTLLHHIAGLELPTTGEIRIDGTNITNLSAEDRAIFRCQNFGMVYQLWYWIKSLSVWENVALPLMIIGYKELEAKEKAMEMLDDVRLTDNAYKRPMQLSGGEQQRVGLARALINNAKIIIADEPTGNLDTHSADEMIQIFQFLKVKHKRTIIMVTHNMAYLPLANHKVDMKDGLIVSDTVNQKQFEPLKKGTR